MTLKNVLKRFNRKERNWVVRDALGEASSRLDPNFCDRIVPEVRRLHADFTFDADPYWATDFHFDWLVGALHRLKHPDEHPNTPQSNYFGLVNGSQEDIDLVIATDDTLLLIEAKGEGAWSNSQLTSKIGRLQAMTTTLVNADGWAGKIRVVFLLCSPRDTPPHVLTDGWPKWTLDGEGHPIHFELKRPTESFLAVSRCKGTKPDKDGNQWLIRDIEYPPKTARS